MKCLCTLTTLIALTVLNGGALGQEAGRRDAERERSDQLLAAVQQICPVSGNKLGEHGTPIKVRIGQEEVFLCCEGCTKGKVDPKHWATIHANFAKAQGECPVMEKRLPKNPKWTIVEGHVVFVCCPPCTKKIEADPATYLAKVDALYAAALKKSAAR